MAGKNKRKPNKVPPIKCTYRILEMSLDDKFAVEGDVHAGRIGCQWDSLREFHKDAAADGVKTFFDAGDITNGLGVGRNVKGRISPDQSLFISDIQMKLDAITKEQQLALLANRFPRIEGTKTYVIQGNHDILQCVLGHGNRVVPYMEDEVDFATYFQNHRPDIECIGSRIGVVRDQKKNVIVEVVHPVMLEKIDHPYGSAEYINEISNPDSETRDVSLRTMYKSMMKYIDHIKETVDPSLQPDVEVIGHNHWSFHTKYRGIDVIFPGCFVKPHYLDEANGNGNGYHNGNGYGNGNGNGEYNGTIGGWIVEMSRGRNDRLRVKAENLTY
jgi:hypothetical protein